MEFGQPKGRDVPDFLQVDTDVIVYQDIAHATDTFPIQVSQAATGVGRNTFGCFADHLNVSDYRILTDFRGQESFLAWSDDARNSSTTFHK